MCARSLGRPNHYDRLNRTPQVEEDQYNHLDRTPAAHTYETMQSRRRDGSVAEFQGLQANTAYESALQQGCGQHRAHGSAASSGGYEPMGENGTPFQLAQGQVAPSHHYDSRPTGTLPSGGGGGGGAYAALYESQPGGRPAAGGYGNTTGSQRLGTLASNADYATMRGDGGGTGYDPVAASRRTRNPAAASSSGGDFDGGHADMHESSSGGGCEVVNSDRRVPSYEQRPRRGGTQPPGLYAVPLEQQQQAGDTVSTNPAVPCMPPALAVPRGSCCLPCFAAALLPGPPPLGRVRPAGHMLHPDLGACLRTV